VAEEAQHSYAGSRHPHSLREERRTWTKNQAERLFEKAEEAMLFKSTPWNIDLVLRSNLLGGSVLDPNYNPSSLITYQYSSILEPLIRLTLVASYRDPIS
jgi:hypothetical protein